MILLLASPGDEKYLTSVLSAKSDAFLDAVMPQNTDLRAENKSPLVSIKKEQRASWNRQSPI